MSSSLSAFTPLLKGNYARLTTFRKNGAAIATPMWFAENAGVVYMYTDATSGKVKRIRNSGRVTLAPCTARGKVTGAEVEAQARIVSDSQEIARAEAALAKKYGIRRRLLYFAFSLMSMVRRQTNDTDVYLAIEA
ncbi:MAG TPA: PPOX class F420-dependent oxidoreductase [Ktedonobacteraceae bacterium]|jgi:PPOX class probable F420-dependent enzyme|nr:PPOX class F420-dependent oxidoreductase [Ktedonobacteraceae bacterium]